MSASDLVIVCTTCHSQLRCHLYARGKRVRCPYCKQAVFVPVGTPEPAPKDEVIDPAKFQVECEEAVVRLGNALACASRAFATSAVLTMLRELPRNPQQLDAPDRDSLLMRCLDPAHGGREPLPELVAFITHVSKMSPAHRALLEASVTGTLIGHGIVRRLP